MGILSKFLFEEVDTDLSYNDTETTSYNVLSTESSEVVTNDVTQDNLISDIYEKNDFSDMSKSIFKVEELINSLPKEMPNETKKATVLSILSSFGLTVDEVAEDGARRIELVENAGLKIVQENENVINQNNISIEQKKIEIQELEKDTSVRSTLIKDTADKIETESKRITNLITFVGGTV